jgi:hypothetical protein
LRDCLRAVLEKRGRPTGLVPWANDVTSYYVGMEDQGEVEGN